MALPKPRLPLPQPLLYVPPFPIPTQENGGRGRGKDGGLTSFITRQFLRFRRKAETITVIDQWLGKHGDTDSPDRRCFHLPLSFPHLKSHVSEPLDLKTQGPVPGFMELTAILHKVKTTRASVCGPSAAAKLWTARGRSSTTCNLTLTHTHTYPQATWWGCRSLAI